MFFIPHPVKHKACKKKLYYHVSVHGKGLMDVMSALGIKRPIRRADAAKHFSFNCAEDIFNYLADLFKVNDKKSYFYL